LFLWINAAAKASPRPPPPNDPSLGAAPGTAAALRSRFSESLTFLNAPAPPPALIEASTSSLAPVGLRKVGALAEFLPGGNGGGGGPSLDGIGGGGGGAPEEGSGGGGGGPAAPGAGGAGLCVDDKIGGCGAAALRYPGIGGGGGAAEVGGTADRFLGGRGGGAAALGGGIRGDEDWAGVRLGGGGGTVYGVRSAWKGGGTPNLGFISLSSSIGVLGGLGGGSGPELAKFEVAPGRVGRLGAGTWANLPAPGSGGGILNW